MAGDKVLQVSQIGIESVPGTQVAAGTILHAISFMMQREGGGATTFRPEGYRGPVLTKRNNREFSNIPVELAADYRSLVWVFDSLFEAVTPAQEGATVAWKRTYTLDANAALPTRKTFTLERGDATLASYATWLQFSGFGITLNRDDTTATATAFAGKRVDGHTLTGTPTEVAAIPILAEDGLIYVENTLAALTGATAQTRPVEVEWHFNSAYKPRFSANSDVSFSDVTALAPEIGGTMKFWKNSTSMALRAAAQAGSRRWLRLKWVGPLIASTYYHTLQITTAIEFVEPGDEADEDDAVAISLGFVSVQDAAAGYMATVELTTDIDGSYAIDV